MISDLADEIYPELVIGISLGMERSTAMRTMVRAFLKEMLIGAPIVPAIPTCTGTMSTEICPLLTFERIGRQLEQAQWPSIKVD
ncbi:MAG: hypothetical protein ACLS8R_07570 [Anaeromassilibacillus sp.]